MTEINQSRTDALAAEVLTFSRDTLLVNLRFLDAALDRLPFISYSGTMKTDGQGLYYDPRFVLKAYKNEQSLPTRHCLHVIFHCVFGHLSLPGGLSSSQRRFWNLAADIAGEYTISCLNLQAAASQDQNRMERVFAKLLERTDILTCEKIYKCLLKTAPDEEELEAWENLFKVDDHGAWYGTNEEIEAAWKGISHRMQIDMETFTRQQGNRAGALLLNLKEVNRQVSDYDGFIRKFATRSDGMKLNPDEFDYTLYSYGLQMSGGKVPLIEQTEYKDSMRVRDIALAIYAHDLLTPEKVKLFLLNTWDILHSTESFSSKVRLHILLPKKDVTDDPASYIQVLSGIEDIVVSSGDEMREFVEGFTLPEAHGNDFRPVFDKVRDLSRTRAFKNLRGLLILTEDVGLFPASMPAFPGAFIFVNNDYSVPPVPAWAIRLVLQSDEL